MNFVCLLVNRRTLLLGLAALIFITISGQGPARADTDDGRLYFAGFSISKPKGPGWTQGSVVTEELDTGGGYPTEQTTIQYYKGIALFHEAAAVVVSSEVNISGGIPDVMRRRFLEILAREVVADFSREFHLTTFDTSFETPFGIDCVRFDSTFEEPIEHAPNVMLLGSMHGYLCIHPEMKSTLGALYTEILTEGEEPSSTLKAEGEAFLRSIEIHLEQI